MNGLTRWLPWGIIAISIVHTLYAFTMMPGAWGGIARAGVLNGIEGDADREAALWFFYAGMGFLAIGTLALKHVRATGGLPRQVAFYLLGIGGSMVVIEPASGGWAVVVLGLLALEARRRETATG
ncbi:hypothetical protein J4573_10535 [Actinomadura barringtoniae]|uniref:Uncharacterized protein n=1 Tax=Actinomadura barringtoniae TaxID=1427535 RepID=A0A939P8A8_9ACTN|nr:DUF6463 family protein [Actinomadura barringtoniae]MBO2447525.1 hypothetical protein [Actinomadura barringtoniae]